uniref:RNA-directed RNA polymerase n=2 Tax=Opium poppy mosaic virus TaxID=473784 RepID=A0A346SCH0_9TOMB|nr:RNA-dependent RNA polymerase [Opium poppy mosaic virus]
MDFVDRITRWLSGDFKPSAYIKSRNECVVAYGEEWATLVTQSRMQGEASRQYADWYNSASPTTCTMPPPTDAELIEEARVGKLKAGLDQPKKQQEAASTNLGGIKTPPPMSEEQSTLLDLEALPSYDQIVAVGKLRRLQLQSACPQYTDEERASWAIIPYTGGPRVIREDEVLPRAPSVVLLNDAPRSMSKIEELVKACFATIDKVAKRRKVDCIDFSSEVAQTPPSKYKLQEPGEVMKGMNAQSVAMELRRRYGMQPCTAANLQLGNRVAREILDRQCQATREQVYYYGHLATTMWFQPTLVDLALRAGAKDFLIGDVYARAGMETRVKASIHPAIRVMRAARPRAVDRVSYQIDVVRPCADFGVHNNSLNNLIRGVNERVFYTDHKRTVPVKPLPTGFDEIDISMLKTFKVSPWTMEQVVESYKGSQKTRYQNALESLRIQPLTRADARVKTFVKAEKINFTAKPDPAPRVIQPRDPRFNLCFAKYTKPLEPMLYKQLGKLYKYPCIAKGFNAVETGEIIAKKWAMFKDPVCVGLDASRFDQHVSVEALRFTHKVYKRFVRGHEVNKLLSWMYTNHALGSAKDGYVKYEITGCRMSGDMDTALGNCTLMVLMTHHLCKSLDIEHELMNNGDDCIIIMDQAKLPLLQQNVAKFYERLGFKMKVEEPVFQLERVDFCQTRPVYDGRKWRMVRHISSISKDCCTVINWEQLAPWWCAIGTCGLAVAAGIPIHNSFLKWLKRSGGDEGGIRSHALWKNEGLAWYRMGLDLSHEDHVSDAARLSFQTAFGISPEMQVALEGIYDSLPAPSVGGRDYRTKGIHGCETVVALPSRHFNNYFDDVPTNTSQSHSADPGDLNFEPGVLWNFT